MDGEQERQLLQLFKKLPGDFVKFEGEKSLEKQETILKKIAKEIEEGMRLVKEFEREARADGEPEEVVSKRKKELVKELNAFIGKYSETYLALLTHPNGGSPPSNTPLHLRLPLLFPAQKKRAAVDLRERQDLIKSSQQGGVQAEEADRVGRPRTTSCA